MTEKHKINAILEEDLVKILETKGLLKDINENRIKCGNCEKTIQISNISSIHVANGKFIFHCDSDKCQISKLNEQC